jgi:hypothetical protein
VILTSGTFPLFHLIFPLTQNFRNVFSRGIPDDGEGNPFLPQEPALEITVRTGAKDET